MLFNPLVMKIPKLLLISLIVTLCYTTKAQPNFGFTDGRNIDPICIKAANIINSMPKEVLFGIEIKPTGEVYFSISNKEWFNKIFTVANCISVDVVAKEKYNCASYTPTNGTFKGYVMPPLQKIYFKQNTKEDESGRVVIKLGVLPGNFANKEMEGNLIIGCDRKVSYYNQFVDIDRAAWQLLPMGLYTDTLIEARNTTDTLQENLFTYTRKVQVIVPFLKGKATYNKADLKPIYDSLNLARYDIKKLDIFAYASVEGDRTVNENLVRKRAEAMTEALRQYNVLVERVNILTAENWIEFLQTIQGTPLIIFQA